MALTTNFNFNPYYDDYNESKKFLRILFKPGYSVQARELTQLQTMLQKQIERFGNNIFINGSAILDGKSAFQTCVSLKLETTYSGSTVDIAKFANKIIYNDTNTKRAQVIVAAEADSTTNEPPTLLIQQLYGDAFGPDEVIKTNDANPEFARVQNSLQAITTGQTFTIEPGVFYIDGYFVKTDAQAIAISKYDTSSATLKVGFEVKEYFITANDDSSLIDPAQEASNYQAPGADRYKVDLVLATRSFESEDLENFIELAQFKAGIYQSTRKLTIYNKITDELARRTFDESGNYVVKPFKVSVEANTANSQVFDVTIGPGKGYVLGYEISMDYPRVLTLDKARDVVNVTNRVISTTFGNYFLTDNYLNTFSINSMPTVDLHCVYRANIDSTTATTYNSTKIGTARIKSVDYSGATNVSVGSTYIYAASLFDVNTSNISGTTPSVTDNQTITLENASSSSIDDAYVGAFLRFTSGPASGEGSKLIVDYNGSEKRVTVNPAFVNLPVSGNSYRIEFNVQDTESVVEKTGSTTIVAAADISKTSGIDPTTLNITNKAILNDNKMEAPIFNLGANFLVNNTLTNITYQYQRTFTSTISGGVSGTISADSGEQFATVSDDASKRLNYQVINTTTGQVVPSESLTLTINNNNLTVAITGVSSATILVLATITRTISSDAKSYIKANTTYASLLATASMTSVDNIFVAPSVGQISIPASRVIKNPNLRQPLYMIDVIKLVKVVDLNGAAIYPVQSTFNNAKDITSSYVLDNGQRDSYYDYASIQLKPGATPPVGPLIVYVDRLQHGASRSGYFSVNSYPADFPYESIPGYLTSSGAFYELRDCLDFRQSMTDALPLASKTLNMNASTPKFPKRNSQISASFDRYMGRIDKIHLTAEGNYGVSRGVASDFPTPPSELSRALTLYEVSVPPYTLSLKEIEFKEYESRRYTMKDIAGIDRRLRNVEYYTSLSLLENETASKSDVSLFDRSKNGIITDSFVGFDVVDITTGDYTASIDRDVHELRPSANITTFPLVFDSANSSNYRTAPGNQTLPGSNFYFLKAADSAAEIVLSEQPHATKAISVNPYNVQNFIGTMRLKPQSDIWIDVNRLPDVIIQDAANAAMIEFINESKKWAQIEWGSWNRTSLGSRETGRWTQRVSLGGRWFRNDTWRQVEWQDNQRRLGTKTYFVPQEVRTSLGDTLVNSETIPWMRKKEIIYTVTGMKPFSILYPFFDGRISVKKYVSAHNYLTINTQFRAIQTTAEQMAGGIPSASGTDAYFPFDSYQPNVPNSGRIFIKDGGTIVGNAVITLISGNRMYVDNVNVVASGVNWPGDSIFIEKPSTNQIPRPDGTYPSLPASVVNVYRANVKLVKDASTAYVYRTGTVRNITTETLFTGGGAQTIQLSSDSANASIKFAAGDSPIRVVLEDEKDYTEITQQSNAAPAEWAEREAIISGISGTTTPKTVTLEAGSRLRVNTTSIVQIGEVVTDGNGGLAGSFYCPRGRFRTGEKAFRFSNLPTGDFGEANARAESRFFAQGRLNTVEERILATIQPVRFTENFTEDRTLITFTNERVATGAAWRNDPIAQTFLVEPSQHPDGVFLSKVRVCFKARDEVIPVRLQVRPSVNGYPSATDVYPFADVLLTPDQVNLADQVTGYPSLNDPLRYTDFVFEAPVHLAPGEHSIVLLSNSNLYEAWIATKDETDVVTRARVSTQPHTGSFFKSQNGQTWTAEQESDMMFRIFFYQFSDSDTATISLELDADELPSSNVKYDLMRVQTQEIDFGNTSVTYTFNSHRRTDGARTGELSILPNEDILMLDNFGARILDPSRGPASISVKAQLRTRNKDISPVLDLDRFGVVLIEQVLNNLSLANTDFFVSNVGLYSATSATPAVTISGGGGVGATAVANVVTTAGVSRTIDKIIVTNGGSGYKTTPNVTISGGTLASGGYAATAGIIGEDKQFGGNSLVRHIVKRVTLADGFSSGDLRVYLTAHKPPGSSIDVYYKILASGDQEIWREKQWQLMTQIDNVSYVSDDIEDFAELVFAPGVDNKPDNIVSYNSNTSGEFHEFTSFQIKIVLSGVNTVDVPRVRDFRAMALPAA